MMRNQSLCVKSAWESKQQQTKPAKVKKETCLNSDNRHGHNGDKLQRRNPKRRREMVVLCEAFKQSFRALFVFM